MRTLINDIVPKNMGANGLVFDPAVDWLTKTIGVSLGVSTGVGISLYQGFSTEGQ
jgi:hypothetical protein